jgi:DNA-binding response OmpR family regulator
MNMRLLVVEDETRIRSFLARALEAEGFEVDEVEDGERGLEAALAHDYELVILDLLLPGRDGLDVLREIHQHRPELPVLILSARTELATKLRSFELGAADYMAKPFSLDELFARVRVQTRLRYGTESDTTLRLGRLALDPRSNVVDVCVRRLRRQLGPDAPIETVRNAGYRAAA